VIVQRRAKWTIAAGVMIAALAGAAGMAVNTAGGAKALAGTIAEAVDSTALGRDFQDRVARARPGDTITLEPGDYGRVNVQNLNFAKAVTVKGSGAIFRTIRLWSVTGLHFDGISVATPPGGRTMGVDIRRASDVRLDSITVTGSRIGIGIGRSSDIAVTNSSLSGLQSDGINIALSRKIMISGNSCRDFSPIHSEYDANGTLTKVGDHPDCIQSWSRPDLPPVADILVENNRMEGDMQGIFFGNHIRNGVDDGGFDRIIVRNNIVRVTHPNGIALLDARDSIVTGNRVSTFPGGVNPRRPGARVRSMLRVKGGTGNRACGNVIADFPDNPAAKSC
jgi:nitrous oxidase accessory protein NosD